MKLILTKKTLETLRLELRQARRREIGGVLVGEHLEGETFALAGLSVQRDGGSDAHFVRDPEQHKVFLNSFFAETGHRYDRFNYLGEWHSHPGFLALPSPTDCETMYGIVENPQVASSFAVLMVARLHPFWGLQLSATGFRAGILPDSIELSCADCAAKQFEQIRPRSVRRFRFI